jgi:hypothetical protein
VWVTHDVEPGDPWCDVVQYAAANGDVVRLAPGDYEGDCIVLKSGIPDEGEPLAIVGRGDGPVRILGRPGAPVLTVVGNYVRLGHLHLVAAPGAPVVVARGRSLLIDECILEGGSLGIDLGAATGGLSAIGNVFEDVATPIQAPCEADACDRSRFVLRDNVFRHARPQGGAAVAIATEIELEVTENVIEGAWAKGFELECRSGAMRVQQNVILGASIGLELAVGTGGADVFNNLVTGTRATAIAWRGAIGAVRIVGNTVVPASGEAFSGPAPSLQVANAVLGVGGSTGDIACAEATACWVDPANGDFRPRLEGPLVMDGLGPPPSTTTRDLCSSNRRDNNAAGAIAASTTHAMRLQPVRRSSSGCFRADYIDSALAARRAPVVVDNPLPTGCQQGHATTIWVLLLVFPWVGSRRNHLNQ